MANSATATAAPLKVSIAVDEVTRVSGLWQRPAHADATFVFAHGAGADMHHVFMHEVAERLAARGIATLRYQFPFSERGSRRPDGPERCEAAVRAAVAAAARLDASLPLVAGGKSFGGRMTSQAHARGPLAGVRALAFLGFPLHPANKPSVTRAEHLASVHVPLLFLQGTRDALASVALLRSVLTDRHGGATVHLIDGADHAFHVPARSGRTDSDVLDELAQTLAHWIRDVTTSTPSASGVAREPRDGSGRKSVR